MDWQQEMIYNYDPEPVALAYDEDHETVVELPPSLTEADHGDLTDYIRF